MAATNDAPAAAAERTLVITRVFEAPRELVFRAWTEPEHVLRWLGPKEFTALEFEMDRRVGGAWYSRMRSPEGTVHSNRGIVREIVPSERIAFTFGWDDPDGSPGREMLITITFAEHDGGTEMTFAQSVFDSVEDRDGHREGWSESFDKLAEYLVSA